MGLSDWLFGRRLATLEEEQQRVGVLAGIPMLGLDALASAAYGPEAALTLLIPLGIGGVRYIGPITHLDHRLARGGVLFVPADDRRLPAWWRIVHRGQGEPRHQRGPVGRGGADARLRPGGGRRHLGGRGRTGLGGAGAPAAHARTLPGHPDDDHDREPARRPGVGHGVPDTDVPVRRFAPGRAGHRARQDDRGGRASGTGGPATGAPFGAGGGDVCGS